jgi:hypothetical protein
MKYCKPVITNMAIVRRFELISENLMLADLFFNNNNNNNNNNINNKTL